MVPLTGFISRYHGRFARLDFVDATMWFPTIRNLDSVFFAAKGKASSGLFFS